MPKININSRPQRETLFRNAAALLPLSPKSAAQTLISIAEGQTRGISDAFLAGRITGMLDLANQAQTESHRMTLALAAQRTLLTHLQLRTDSRTPRTTKTPPGPKKSQKAKAPAKPPTPKPAKKTRKKSTRRKR